MPSICSLCHQVHKSTHAVCDECTDLFKPITNPCSQCAYPLPDADYPTCGLCIKTPPLFDRTFIPYIFEEPLRSLIHEFKYHEGLYLGSFLSNLILDKLKNQELHADCLIPVPMHPHRLKQRGFNQAAILTKLLAKALTLPYDLSACNKLKNTKPQANLNGEERKHNLFKAFEAPALPYRHIVLVDDLMTTGNTANELARVLKKSGVQRVDVCCCARAV